MKVKQKKKKKKRDSVKFCREWAEHFMRDSSLIEDDWVELEKLCKTAGVESYAKQVEKLGKWEGVKW